MLTAFVERSKNVASMLYPDNQKALVIASALSISLFVISILTAFTGVKIPEVGWISFGLAGGSFATLMLAGLWNHGFEVGNQKNVPFCGCQINLTKWHVGRFKEVLLVAVLGIISLLGATGVISPQMMAERLFGTQLGFALVFYGLIGNWGPDIAKKVLEFINEGKLNIAAYERMKIGYPLEKGGAKAWAGTLFSGALLASVVVLTAISAWGNTMIPGLPWINVGLTVVSFATMIGIGLQNHRVHIGGGDKNTVGLSRETLHSIAFIAFSVLFATHVLTVEQMAYAILGTYAVSMIVFHTYARKVLKRTAEDGDALLKAQAAEPGPPALHGDVPSVVIRINQAAAVGQESDPATTEPEPDPGLPDE